MWLKLNYFTRNKRKYSYSVVCDLLGRVFLICLLDGGQSSSGCQLVLERYFDENDQFFLVVGVGFKLNFVELGEKS